MVDTSSPNVDWDNLQFAFAFPPLSGRGRTDTRSGVTVSQIHVQTAAPEGRADSRGRVNVVDVPTVFTEIAVDGRTDSRSLSEVAQDRAGISIFDPSVTGGHSDPNFPEATPGVLIKAGTTPVTSFNTWVPVRGSVAAARLNQRVPPDYIQPAGDRFLNEVRFSKRIPFTTVVSLQTTATSQSGALGDDFANDHEANIGVAVRDSAGNTSKFLISELGDATEPYSGRFVAPGAPSLAAGACTFVLVDTAHPNVDWGTLQVKSADVDHTFAPDGRADSRGKTTVSLAIPDQTLSVSGRTFTRAKVGVTEEHAIPVGGRTSGRGRVEIETQELILASGQAETRARLDFEFTVILPTEISIESRADSRGGALISTFAVSDQVIVGGRRQNRPLGSRARTRARVGEIEQVFVPDQEIAVEGRTATRALAPVEQPPVPDQEIAVEGRSDSRSGIIFQQRFGTGGRTETRSSVVVVDAIPPDQALSFGNRTTTRARVAVIDPPVPDQAFAVDGRSETRAGTLQFTQIDPIITDIIAYHATISTPSSSSSGGRRRRQAVVSSRTYFPQQGSVSIDKALNARNTASFMVKMDVDDLPTSRINDGAEVAIFHGREIVFGGFVRDPVERFLAGGERVHVQCECVSYAGRLEEIRVEGFVRTQSDQPVGDIVRTLINDHASSVGLNLAGVTATDTVKGDVFDYITVAEALNRLATQSNSVWCVTAQKVLMFVPRDLIRRSSAVIDGETLEGDFELATDRQHLRTVQTVIGGPYQHGQRRQDFNGDGVSNEYGLHYLVSRVIEVSVNGVSQDFNGPMDVWQVDVRRSVLVGAVLQPSDELSVLYNYNFPIVITRENAAAIAKYRDIHKLETDPALDTVDLAEARAESLLQRHDNPTRILRGTTRLGAIRNLLEGTGVVVNFPRAGIDAEIWMVDRVTTTEVGGLPRHAFELLAHDHEFQYESFWDKLTKLEIPTALTLRQEDSAAASAIINPGSLAQEGLRLPAALGGYPKDVIQSQAWVDIPHFAVARLNGRRLPSNLVEWRAMARVDGGLTGQVRLYNKTSGTARGGTVSVTGATPELIFVRRITLSANISDYVLQGRITSASPDRFAGLYVWAGQIDVGD